MSWPIHFAGYDPQIARKCTPLEQARVWLFGVYLIFLIMLGGVAMLYATYVLLGGMEGTDPVSETVIEFLLGGAGFLLLWNTYRMILLVRMPEPGDDHKTALSGALIRQCSAALFGACIAVIGTLAWVHAADLRRPAETTSASTMRQWVATEETSRSALDELYLRRGQAVDARVARWQELAAKSGSSATAGTVDFAADIDYQRLSKEITQLDRQIIESRHNIEIRHQIDATRGAKERGFAHEIGAIVDEYQPLNWLIWLIVMLMYCAPVMARDMGNKSEYEFRSEMQNIRNLAAHRIIPKVASAPCRYTLPWWLSALRPLMKLLKSLKLLPTTVIHMNKYLGPEALLRQTRQRLHGTDDWVRSELQRWMKFARSKQAVSAWKSRQTNSQPEEV